jgi:fumarate reductase (CoM/CoB) subunit A
VFPYWKPGDDTDNYMREIIEYNSEYLIDQDYVKIAVKESYDRFRDLVSFGVEFAKEPDGSVRRIQTLTSKYGYCSPFAGGHHLTWKIRAEAARRGVRLLDRIMLTDLIVQGERCLGAVGFQVREGKFFVIKSKATVLAAGGLLFNRAQMGASGACGDGYALAFRAGAQLRNMDQIGHVQIGPKNLGSPGLHVIFGEGGIMVNAKGERFMKRYNPTLLEEARRFESARAILQEWREGRGPCYLDCTHLPAKKIDIIKRSLPLMVRGLKSQGLDIAKDKIEYIPYSVALLHMGGTRIRNADGDVGIEGLWVVGAAGDYCGGADATAVTALPGSSVQGVRGGLQAAKYLKKAGRRGAIPREGLAELKERALAPLNKRSRKGIEAEAVFHQLLSTVFRYINVLKSEPMLEKAVSEIGKLKAKMSGVVSKDPHDLQKYHNVRNMLPLAEVAARASLIRKESRRGHFRLDYPQRDDENWLKWVVAEQADDEIRIWTEDIPIAKWKYKPSTSAAKPKGK